MKKNKKYKSPAVGYSLSRTTSDNGCGPHEDKRTKRKRTRETVKRNFLREYD